MHSRKTYGGLPAPRLSLMLADDSPVAFLAKTTYSPPSWTVIPMISRERVCSFPFDMDAILKCSPSITETPSLDHFIVPMGFDFSTHSKMTFFAARLIVGLFGNVGAKGTTIKHK